MKMNDILQFVATWMQTEHILPNEIGWTDKDKNGNTDTWTLKKPNLQSKEIKLWLVGMEVLGDRK